MQNNIFRITSTISQNVLRSYARKATHRKKLANPGIDKRIRILEEKDEYNLENIDVEELESDFMALGHVHRQHEKELKYNKEKEKYWIVRQKYFKENKSNFLSWSDKEQIRYLHQTNPNEWTIEQLSEGFPALPETITKIIKTKWQKSTETKKRNHDRAVENNWKLLQEGKFCNELSPNLMAHLKKFSSRKQGTVISENKYVLSPSETNKSQHTGEFASIIKSYDQLRNKTKLSESNKTETNVIGTEYRMIERPETADNKPVTLQRWKRNNTKDVVDIRKTESNQDEMNLKELFHKEENVESSIPDKYNINEVIKHKHSKVSELAQVDNKKAELVTYPEKITIPKGKYKKGSTYKVNDCYYDDDGEFLYRVPGMY